MAPLSMLGTRDFRSPSVTPFEEDAEPVPASALSLLWLVSFAESPAVEAAN